MSSLIDPTEQTGKSRAQRIRLNYVHHRHGLSTWRWVAAGIGILVPAIYLAWISLAPRGTLHLSTGKLSAAHASFEQACSQCHIDFVPIASDAWHMEPQIAIGKTAAKCRQCHGGVGHHSAVFNVAGERIDQQCAGCHGEHRGRKHQLIPSMDKTCTDCHQETSRLCATPERPAEFAVRNVTRFSNDDHGDFRSLLAVTPEKSPSIAFDHALHMQPGQTAAGQRGAMRLDRLSTEHRQRYQRRGQQDDALVQLQCADCHQFQSESAGRVRSGDLDWGRNSLPIRFDQHCIACHPLTMPGQRQSQVGLPHGVPPQALRDTIRGQLAALDGAGQRTPFSHQADGPPVRIPGTQSARSSGVNQAVQDASADGAAGEQRSLARLELITGRVHQQCQVCHIATDWDATVSMPRMPRPRLRAGRYNHGAHRSVVCIACHPAADPGGRTGSLEARPALADWLRRAGVEPLASSGSESQPGGQRDPQVDASNASNPGPLSDLHMILGIQSCTPCHRPSASVHFAEQGAVELRDSYTALFGGLADHATDRCTSCHQYHTYAAPPQSDPLALESLKTDDFHAPVDLTFASAAEDLVSTPTPAAGSAAAPSSAAAGPVAAQPSASPHGVRAAGFSSPSGQWIGSDSCATSTCHGGPVRREPDWNSSQTVFEAHDPHARAGLVLGDPWSRRIVMALDPEAGASPERFLQVMRTRCNGCHAPINAKGVVQQPGLRLAAAWSTASTRGEEIGELPGGAAEGVSCEACHGPASGWLQSHLQQGWPIGDEMRENRDYIARLEGCVRCHVGSRRADGLVRDVNHDMIAAGHPTLRFDPWSAWRRLPRHGTWNQATDGLPDGLGERELRRFLVGRVVALRAAIQLTVQQLEDARLDHNDSVWPELAMYDCFACHHRLKITNFATRPRTGYPAPYPWLQTGLIEYGLRQIAPEDAGRLTQAMETFRLRSAGGKEILPAARTVETILNRYLTRLSDPRDLPADVVAWRPFGDAPSPGPNQAIDEAMVSDGDWYDAAYWYLRSHVLLREDGRASRQRSIETELDQLGNALQFGRPEHGNQLTVDSPEFFEMKVYRQSAKRLTELVESE